MATIFLSHSSKNNTQAIAIRDWLASEGWKDVFLDLDPERGIKAGERWQETLKRASSTCELVIFLLSPAWATSNWCLAEFLLAKQLNKRVLGAIVEPTPFETIPVEMSGEWQVVDLIAGFEKRAFSVAEPTEKAPRVVRLSADGLERLKIGLCAAGLDPKFFPWPPAHDPERSPYRGLRPLEEDDAGIFFGRDGPIVVGLDLIRGLREAAPPRMLVILGASGAGKSSFMRAGLLPRLSRDSQHYCVLPAVRPYDAEGDASLIGALQGAFRAIDQPKQRADIRKACAASAQEVADLVAPLVQPSIDGAAPRTLILPIEQGEELFLAEGAEEARAFLLLLRDLLLLKRPKIVALITIRSDSYEPLQSAAELEGITQQTFSLPPMPRGAFSDIILGPVRRFSESTGPFKFDDALVAALLADIGESAAKEALPLLAFTLERLYREYGADGNLALAEYEATGRIRGSIEAAVEQALKEANAHPDIPRERVERLRLLRRAIIPALAGVDPDTGTPRRRVARMREIPTEARPLVQLLIDQRLLTTDIAQEIGETTVEPAHEALLRQWGTLEGWLEDESEDLAMFESLRRGARDWEANERNGEWLVHAGGRLQLADGVARREDFANLFGPEERAYLEGCREAEEVRRAARRRITASVFGALLILLAFASWQWWEAQAEADRARANESAALVALSSPDALMPGPVEATTKGVDPDIVRFKENGGAVSSVAFSRDGTLLAAGTWDGTIWLRNMRTRDSRLLFEGEGKQELSRVSSVAFSPAGAHLAAGTERGGVKLWSIKENANLIRLNDLKTRVRVKSVGFSSDGKRLAAGSEDRKVMLWNLDGSAVRKSWGSGKNTEDEIWSVALSLDGSILAAGSEDRTTHIWDTATKVEIARLEGHRELVTGVVFSPAGDRLATASRDGTARLWDIATGAEITRLEGHTEKIWSIAFRPKGRQHVATGSGDGTARIWNVVTGMETETARKGGIDGSAIWSVAF